MTDIREKKIRKIKRDADDCSSGMYAESDIL